MTRRPLIFAALLVACGGDDRGTPPPPEPDPDPGAAQEPHEPAGLRPEPAPAHVAEVHGTVTLAGADVSEGADVEAERAIEVPEGGSVALQLLGGSRIVVDGPALARVVVEGGTPNLYLVTGSAFATQPPSGNAPRAPLRLCTPSVTAEIGRSGELYVAVFPGGASWVASLSGAISVADGEADGRLLLRSLDLASAQSVVASGRVGEPTPGPERLEAAREAARTLAAGFPEPELPRLQRDLHGQVERLDQALRALETETRRGRELTSQHRAAMQSHSQEEVQRLMRELVDHSRSLYRLRRLATTRWERVRTQALLLASLGSPASPDPVAQREDRVFGLLGP